MQSPELAIARVRQRVRAGVHDIPELVVRRRFTAGLENLESIYKPLLDEWILYDDSGSSPEIIEEGSN